MHNTTCHTCNTRNHFAKVYCFQPKLQRNTEIKYIHEHTARGPEDLAIAEFFIGSLNKFTKPNSKRMGFEIIDWEVTIKRYWSRVVHNPNGQNFQKHLNDSKSILQSEWLIVAG